MSSFEFTATRTYPFTPERLLGVEQRMPIEGDFVPVFIFNRPFELCTPTVEMLGEGAISLTIGRPFGFMQRIGDNQYFRTQKTENIILSPSQYRQKEWQVTLDTPDPITDNEKTLFDFGVQLYVSNARRKLNEK